MTDAGEVTVDSVLERGDVVWREIAGETVLLDLGGKVVMGLNPTGGAVWSGLDGARSLGEIAGELAQLHGVERSRAVDDVLEFARVLVARGLARALAR